MSRIPSGLKLLGIFALGLAVAQAAYKSDSQDDQERQQIYKGSIFEDAVAGDVVSLKPKLIVRNKEGLTGDTICGYTIYKSHSELPFKVELENRDTGAAKIVLAEGYTLNYERRYHYAFEIAAHDCATGMHAPREKVLIEIGDINEYAPSWTQDTLFAEVTANKMYDKILALETVDQDGSDEWSRICHYNILTPDVPFRITDEGYLINTETLSYDDKHNYILEVKAEDCGGRQSDKAMINIEVKPEAVVQTQPTCRAGWSGIQDSVDYVPGSGQVPVAEGAHLDLCGESCPDPQVSAKLVLEVNNADKTCDRDMYSIQSQRKICRAAKGLVELLPNPNVDGWAKEATSGEAVGGNAGFDFDGVNHAIEVPASKFEPHLGEKFTLSTWMKHSENPEDDTMGGAKEHVLCFSDGEYHNRHHYSLFVHNCRLVLLIRREPGKGVDLNVFKEAEWRWALPEVCDGQWHQYAINAELPEAGTDKVQLFIDGKHFVMEKNNPVIVDDWPLHPSKHVTDYKLVIGACWHGKEGRMDQLFRGSLAGLSVLKGVTEEEAVIKCLNNCKEKLDFHAVKDMDSEMSISLNSEMTEITFNGHASQGVEKLLHRVGYTNTRLFPIPGHRTLTLSTDVTCGGDSPNLTIPPVEFMVMVAQSSRPIITISGTTQINREEKDVGRGVLVMKNVIIESTTKPKDDDEIDDESIQETYHMDPMSNYQLDSCTVRVEPQMNLDQEHLQYPENLVAQLGLETSQTSEGLIIAGADKVFNYQEVLREIHYFHNTPEDINSRQFVVTCTELNGRYVSNDYIVQLNVIHEVPQEEAVVGAQSAAKLIQPVKQLSVKDSLIGAPEKGRNSIAAVAGSSTGVGMIVIIVVCVGFLMFMIVLGVIRIRSAHQRTTTTTEVNVEDRQDQEMEWDNSALTITVNPMEQAAVYEDEQEVNGLRAEDSESDEDDVSVGTHDEIESSEEEAEKVKDRDLEWDDSTLTF